MLSQINITTIITLFCIFNLFLIGIYYHINFIYGQTINLDKIKDKTQLDINSTNQVTVGDIKISYKKFGNGDPILLIMGYSGSMNSWDPTFLQGIAANHTVIVFDNRGVGGSESGTKNFTIDQFSNDTVGLLNALNISKSDVLGYSMGGMIAQELALKHPTKVDDLILYGTACGGNQSTLAEPDVFRVLSDKCGSVEDQKKRWIPLQLTEKWIKEHPNYLEKFKSVDYPSDEILKLQDSAIFSWFKYGVCDQLEDISQDTLVIAGTQDRVIPYNNSRLLTEKIPGSVLVPIEEGGHKLMFQFPEKLSSEVNKFLDS